MAVRLGSQVINNWQQLKQLLQRPCMSEDSVFKLCSSMLLTWLDVNLAHEEEISLTWDFWNHGRLQLASMVACLCLLLNMESDWW